MPRLRARLRCFPVQPRLVSVAFFGLDVSLFMVCGRLTGRQLSRLAPPLKSSKDEISMITERSQVQRLLLHLRGPLKVSLVVGTVLCLINGSYLSGNVGRIALNYLVPFLVSGYSRLAFASELKRLRGEPQRGEHARPPRVPSSPTKQRSS
jgi:hypothetical protein